MTFIGALRSDGLTAPMVFDGAINGDIFYTYVEQVLLPALNLNPAVKPKNGS